MALLAVGDVDLVLERFLSHEFDVRRRAARSPSSATSATETRGRPSSRRGARRGDRERARRGAARVRAGGASARRTSVWMRPRWTRRPCPPSASRSPPPPPRASPPRRRWGSARFSRSSSAAASPDPAGSRRRRGERDPGRRPRALPRVSRAGPRGGRALGAQLESLEGDGNETGGAEDEDEDFPPKKKAPRHSEKENRTKPSGTDTRRRAPGTRRPARRSWHPCGRKRRRQPVSCAPTRETPPPLWRAAAAFRGACASALEGPATAIAAASAWRRAFAVVAAGADASGKCRRRPRRRTAGSPTGARGMKEQEEVTRDEEEAVESSAFETVVFHGGRPRAPPGDTPSASWRSATASPRRRWRWSFRRARRSSTPPRTEEPRAGAVPRPRTGRTQTRAGVRGPRASSCSTRVPPRGKALSRRARSGWSRWREKTTETTTTPTRSKARRSSTPRGLPGARPRPRWRPCRSEPALPTTWWTWRTKTRRLRAGARFPA